MSRTPRLTPALLNAISNILDTARYDTAQWLDSLGGDERSYVEEREIIRYRIKDEDRVDRFVRAYGIVHENHKG